MEKCEDTPFVLYQKYSRRDVFSWQVFMGNEFMEYYIEYIPYDKQVEFYNKNIKPVEDLEKKLKEARKQLDTGISNI